MKNKHDVKAEPTREKQPITLYESLQSDYEGHRVEVCNRS